MTQYAGMCIGGPMAGQAVAKREQSFKVMSQPERCREPTCKDSKVIHHHGSPAETIYLWHHLGPFAIWIHETLDLATALAEMTIAYSEKHHGNTARNT